MRVCLGFDCNPRLDIIRYDDDVAESGKAYQSTRGIRNGKTEVDFGQVWMRMDSTTNSPYWDAYAILDGSVATEKDIAEKAMELHEEAVNAMDEGLKEVAKRFKELNVPSLTDVERDVHVKLNPSAAGNGKVFVQVEDFKRKISDAVKSSGLQLATSNNYSADEWNEFFDRTLTPDILTVLMKGLPVLKFSGNGIEFQTNDMYEQALLAVAGKVTSDVFARFVETKNNQAK